MALAGEPAGGKGGKGGGGMPRPPGPPGGGMKPGGGGPPGPPPGPPGGMKGGGGMPAIEERRWVNVSVSLFFREILGQFGTEGGEGKGKSKGL